MQEQQIYLLHLSIIEGSFESLSQRIPELVYVKHIDISVELYYTQVNLH